MINSIAIALFLVLGTACSAVAQSNKAGGGGRLEGTWDARVRITNCQTGAEITSFNSIASFMSGGTSIGSTAGIPQANRTPEHGVWRHVGGNNYAFKFKTFSFAQNVPTGWSIVEHQVVLSADANSYTSSGTAKFFDADGNQVNSGCSDAIGTRFDL